MAFNQILNVEILIMCMNSLTSSNTASGNGYDLIAGTGPTLKKNIVNGHAVSRYANTKYLKKKIQINL